MRGKIEETVKDIQSVWSVVRSTGGWGEHGFGAWCEQRGIAIPTHPEREA